MLKCVRHQLSPPQSELIEFLVLHPLLPIKFHKYFLQVYLLETHQCNKYILKFHFAMSFKFNHLSTVTTLSQKVQSCLLFGGSRRLDVRSFSVHRDLFLGVRLGQATTSNSWGIHKTESIQQNTPLFVVHYAPRFWFPHHK